MSWLRWFIALRSRGRVAEHDRDALPAADAGARDPVRLAPAQQLERERQDEARARRPQRMPESDGAAVHVDALAVEPQLLLDGEVLPRERLVDLEEVDRIEREPRTPQRQAD